MGLCPHCEDNIKQEQVKQARFHIFNPVQDLYTFFSIKSAYKQEPFEEARQKELQDKLAEVARNMEVNQGFIKDMINQLATNTQNGEEYVFGKEFNEAYLPIMPLIQSVYKQVKG